MQFNLLQNSHMGVDMCADTGMPTHALNVPGTGTTLQHQFC